MDMEQFNPTAEEFANVMQQMYPDQSHRVIADLRAAKMQQYIQALTQASAEQEEPREPPQPEKRPPAKKRTKTATTGKKDK